MKLYINLFFKTGVPFGCITGIMAGFSGGLEVGVRSGLAQGIYFGFLMSLVLGTFQMLKTKRMSPDSGGNVGPNQTRTESIEGAYADVFDKCLQALNQCKAKVKYSDKKSGSIMAKMPISWKSFGENLSVALSKDEKEKVSVTITSSPKIKITLLDYGKGRQNVTSFFQALNAEVREN